MINFPEQLTISWVQQAYGRGLTPERLLQKIIERAKQHREKNIWITEPSMELVSPYLERLTDYAAQKERMPLWGIPFAIKDNIDLKGVPTTAACPDYAYVPDESATVVQRLIEAGAVPVGKTNMDQFATGLVGTRSPYGEVSNAYQPEMISGGSSSGSAVSVALGMAVFALGTDTAGSGRVPAMLNTLVGWKPPIGSWSLKGVVPACASLDCVTVFARTLQDTQTVNAIAQDVDAACCWLRSFTHRGAQLPETVLVPDTEPEFFSGHREVYRDKWNRCLSRIEAMGIKVQKVDMTMFYQAALILYEGAYVAERWADLRDFVEAHPGSTFPVTEQVLRTGAKPENTAARLFEDLHKLQAYKAEAQRLLTGNVMILPTAGGSYTRDEVREDPIATNSKMGLYTNHCNLLDLTAVAVPEDSTDRSYPFGITIFGCCDEEELVAAYAERFLRAEPVKLAVCGLHKKGFALEYQLTQRGSVYLASTQTASCYRMYKLPSTPSKPGLVYDETGSAIGVDVYAVPKSELGFFMDHVSKPLTIGDVILADGSVVKGFLCEEYAVRDAEEVTQSGVW